MMGEQLLHKDISLNKTRRKLKLKEIKQDKLSYRNRCFDKIKGRYMFAASIHFLTSKEKVQTVHQFITYTQQYLGQSLQG